MKVDEQRDDWPEKRIRSSEWLPLERALDRIEEPALRELLQTAFTPDDLAVFTG